MCKVNQGNSAYLLFDTGSVDFFDLKYRSYYDAKKAGTLDENIEVVTARGFGASGIYGAKDTTKFMVKLPKLKIAGYEMENVVADMSITSKSKVGIRFAKGRVLTFNFPKDELYIHDLANANIEKSFDSFGFDLFPKENSTIVGAIWENSDAEEEELPKYSKVIKMNNVVLDPNDNCQRIFNAIDIVRKEKVIDLTVKDENEEKSYKLEKRDLFKTLKKDADSSK